MWVTKFIVILTVCQMERCEEISAKIMVTMGCFGRKRRMIVSIELGVFWKKVPHLLMSLQLSEISIFSMARGMIAREMDGANPVPMVGERAGKGINGEAQMEMEEESGLTIPA